MAFNPAELNIGDITELSIRWLSINLVELATDY